MRKTYLITSVAFIFILFLQYSCREIEEFPEVPAIEYDNFGIIKSINGLDSVGILSISFTDGDGDLGVSSYDSSVNFYLDIYEIKNGEAQLVDLPDSTINFNAFIPDLTPDGKYKAIKGTIKYFLPLYFMTPFLETDTIYFETSITDRAMHQSNVVTTPVFALQ